MPKTWNEVSTSDAFKALPSVERDAARTQYFDQVVAPKVTNAAELDQVRQQFLRETAKDVAPNTDTPESIVKRNTPAPDTLGVGDFSHQLAGSFLTSPVGSVGDAESVGRVVAREGVGNAVGRKTLFPTTDTLSDALVGKPQGIAGRAGRFVGGVLGPAKFVQGAKAAAPVAGKVASTVLGVTSGTGSRAVEEAFKAGDEGGKRAKIFLDNMTGKAPLAEVVDSAHDAIGVLRLERQQAYNAAIAPFKRNVSFLDLAPIDAALAKTKSIGLNRTGTIETIPGAQKVHKAISDLVDKWRANPALRTPEDLDDMKKAINNLQYGGELTALAGEGTPGAVIIKEARDAISKEIARQVGPGYAKVMKEYGRASDELDEIQRSLSLSDKATVDTGLRKLQSVMRNNVQTSYGYRTELAEKLNAKTGGKLMPALAGQALDTWEPRGLSRYLAGAEAMASYAHPAFALGIPLQSPRVVGNLAYGAGKIARPLAKYATPANAFYNALVSQTNNAVSP